MLSFCAKDGTTLLTQATAFAVCFQGTTVLLGCDHATLSSQQPSLFVDNGCESIQVEKIKVLTETIGRQNLSIQSDCCLMRPKDISAFERLDLKPKHFRLRLEGLRKPSYAIAVSGKLYEFPTVKRTRTLLVLRDSNQAIGPSLSGSPVFAAPNVVVALVVGRSFKFETQVVVCLRLDTVTKIDQLAQIIFKSTH